MKLPAAMLSAIKPNDGYFTLSGPGTLSLNSEGKTVLQPSAQGRHRFLVNGNNPARQRVEAPRPQSGDEGLEFGVLDATRAVRFGSRNTEQFLQEPR